MRAPWSLEMWYRHCWHPRSLHQCMQGLAPEPHGPPRLVLPTGMDAEDTGTRGHVPPSCGIPEASPTHCATTCRCHQLPHPGLPVPSGI